FCGNLYSAPPDRCVVCGATLATLFGPPTDGPSTDGLSARGTAVAAVLSGSAEMSPSRSAALARSMADVPMASNRHLGAEAPRNRRSVRPLVPFELVIERHGPAVLRFCVARLGPDRGEDAFQETLLAALR